jgi:hypothetical protein
MIHGQKGESNVSDNASCFALDFRVKGPALIHEPRMHRGEG